MPLVVNALTSTLVSEERLAHDLAPGPAGAGGQAVELLLQLRIEPDLAPANAAAFGLSAKSSSREVMLTRKGGWVHYAGARAGRAAETQVP